MKSLSKAQKQARARQALADIKSEALVSEKELYSYAEHMIDGIKTGSRLFPSLIPERAASARLPLVVELNGSTDYGIIVTDSPNNPLRVTTSTGISEGAITAYGTAVYAAESGVSWGGPSKIAWEAYSPTSSHDIDVIGTKAPIGGYLELPFLSTSSPTMTVSWKYYGEEPALVTIVFSDSGRGSTGTTVTNSMAAPGLNYTATGVIVPTSRNWFNVSCDKPGRVSFEVMATAGTWTPSPASYIGNMTEYRPNGLEQIMEDSFALNVVAMDLLVTFEGSSLNDQGSIAVCNASQPLQIVDSFYETVASMPYDKYYGRLAAKGDDPGGAHWHYVPSDIRALELQPTAELRPTSYGYVGIKGCAADQPIKVVLSLLVNFSTLLPGYSMDLRPSAHGFLDFLWLMRTEVPLVSSNDNHLKKLLSFAKRKAKQGVKFAINNPDKVVKALEYMAPLLL